MFSRQNYKGGANLVIESPESNGASDMPNWLELQSGHKEIALTAQVTPGFILLSISNLQSSFVRRVHTVLLPGEGGEVFVPTVLPPFDLAPLAELRVPISYFAKRAGVRSLILIFANEQGETFHLFDHVYLPASDPAVLRTRPAWVPIMPALIRRELPVGDAAPAEVIKTLESILQTRFLPVSEVDSSVDSWWVSFCPVALVEAPVAGGIFLRMADEMTLCGVADDFAKKLAGRQGEFGAGVRLGKWLVTLSDMGELDQPVTDALEIFSKVRKVLVEQQLPLPMKWGGVIAAMKACDTINQMGPAGVAAYNRLLQQIMEQIENNNVDE